MLHVHLIQSDFFSMFSEISQLCFVDSHGVE